MFLVLDTHSTYKFALIHPCVHVSHFGAREHLHRLSSFRLPLPCGHTTCTVTSWCILEADSHLSCALWPEVLQERKRADFDKFLLNSHHGQSRTGPFSWKAQIKTQEESLKHWHAPPPAKMYFRVMQGHRLFEFCCRNTGEAVSRFDSTHIPVSDEVTYQVLKLRTQGGDWSTNHSSGRECSAFIPGMSWQQVVTPSWQSVPPEALLLRLLNYPIIK